MFLSSNLHCISNLMTSLLLFYVDEIRSSKTSFVLVCNTSQFIFQGRFHVWFPVIYYFKPYLISLFILHLHNPTWQAVWKIDGWMSYLYIVLIYWMTHRMKIVIISSHTVLIRYTVNTHFSKIMIKTGVHCLWSRLVTDGFDSMLICRENKVWKCILN